MALFGDASVLLDRPDLVASSWLNLASALWFLVTPQPPKPSMLEIITEEWSPNNADIAGEILRNGREVYASKCSLIHS